MSNIAVSLFMMVILSLQRRVNITGQDKMADPIVPIYSHTKQDLGKLIVI